MRVKLENGSLLVAQTLWQSRLVVPLKYNQNRKQSEYAGSSDYGAVVTEKYDLTLVSGNPCC